MNAVLEQNLEWSNRPAPLLVPGASVPALQDAWSGSTDLPRTDALRGSDILTRPAHLILESATQIASTFFVGLFLLGSLCFTGLMIAAIVVTLLLGLACFA